jgi:hypothetical protein
MHYALEEFVDAIPTSICRRDSLSVPLETSCLVTYNAPFMPCSLSILGTKLAGQTTFRTDDLVPQLT